MSDILTRDNQFVCAACSNPIMYVDVGNSDLRENGVLVLSSKTTLTTNNNLFCPMNSMPNAPTPCTLKQTPWEEASVDVKVNGTPVLTRDSFCYCTTNKGNIKITCK